MPVWQKIYNEFKDNNFIIIAVAMDSRKGAPDKWIRDASPSYVSLIDREHHLADLYNMVNVPQAVWINEAGRIVRPTETAGAYEAFRYMELATGAVPENEAQKAKQTHRNYYAALRDWIVNGDDSHFAFDAEGARTHIPTMTSEMALAHVKFRLGQYLLKTGKIKEADLLLQEASRLHPDSWTMWRQWSKPMESGLAAGPDFWERVYALGEKRYYPLPDMEGMPE